MIDAAIPMKEPGMATLIGWRLRALLGDPLPKATLGAFFGQTATLLASGIAIDEALRRAALVSDPELKWICARIAPSLQRGVPFSAALASYKHRLPEIVLPVLEVGEVAGTLEGAARRLEHAFGLSAMLDRKIAHSIFNPWYVIVGLSLFQAAYHLSGSLAAMLSGLLVSLATLTAYYLGGRLLCRVLFRWQALRLWVDTVKLALPQAGTVTRNLAAARWGRSFATLWNSGVAVSHALEVSSRSALNAHYERALRQAARRTRQGGSLSDSLAKTELLPRYLIDMLAVGETAGNMGDSLERFVTLLEDEAFTKASQQFMTFVAVGQILLIFLAFASLPH